jgi:hypothetical protein
MPLSPFFASFLASFKNEPYPAGEIADLRGPRVAFLERLA